MTLRRFDGWNHWKLQGGAFCACAGFQLDGSGEKGRRNVCWFSFQLTDPSKLSTQNGLIDLNKSWQRWKCYVCEKDIKIVLFHCMTVLNIVILLSHVCQCFQLHSCIVHQWSCTHIKSKIADHIKGTALLAWDDHFVLEFDIVVLQMDCHQNVVCLLAHFLSPCTTLKATGLLSCL